MNFVQECVTWSASVGFGAGLPFTVFRTSATRKRQRVVSLRPRTAGMGLGMLSSLNLGLVCLNVISKSTFYRWTDVRLVVLFPYTDDSAVPSTPGKL
jgi:hypothetical protein